MRLLFTSLIIQTDQNKFSQKVQSLRNLLSALHPEEEIKGIFSDCQYEIRLKVYSALLACLHHLIIPGSYSLLLTSKQIFESHLGKKICKAVLNRCFQVGLLNVVLRIIKSCLVYHTFFYFSLFSFIFLCFLSIFLYWGMPLSSPSATPPTCIIKITNS